MALSRSLTTQALSLTLPLSVTMGDSFAVPSLAAALLLGLRERMGGNPDHISVVTVPAPVADGAPGEVRDALLLHDTVPGGTGYLTDLVAPEEIWRVLATAHGIVAECECRHENRLACHRCLLPFSRGSRRRSAVPGGRGAPSALDPARRRRGRGGAVGDPDVAAVGRDARGRSAAARGSRRSSCSSGKVFAERHGGDQRDGQGEARARRATS